MGEHRENFCGRYRRHAEKFAFRDHHSGYGMAVAQAQYPVAEITEKLRARGIKFALVFTRWQGACRAT